MNRAAALAAGCALALIPLLTACSGGTSDAEPESSPSSPKAKQVTPAERLAKLMVTKAELSGREVKPISREDDEYVFAKSPDDITVDQPACAPLAHAMNQLPLGDPQADLTHYVTGGAGGGTYTYITLTTYAPGKAEAALAGLSKGVEACGDGFTAKANGSSTYDSVTAEKPASPAGDESLGFRSTLTFRGVTHTMHTEAVRSGDLVAVYYSVDAMAMVNARPSDAKLPAPVVKAQNAKLR